MKARLLPTNEFAEFGKTDTQILMASINKTEAGILMDWLLDDREATWEDLPNTVRLFYGYLQVIADRPSGGADMVNTDGALKSRVVEVMVNGKPAGFTHVY